MLEPASFPRIKVLLVCNLLSLQSLQQGLAACWGSQALAPCTVEMHKNSNQSKWAEAFYSHSSHLLRPDNVLSCNCPVQERIRLKICNGSVMQLVCTHLGVADPAQV